MKMIVGLGNPGKDYEKTRHNMGFMVIDYFAKKNDTRIDRNKFDGVYGEVFVDGEMVILVKPMSFMNLSGEVVRKYADYFKIDLDDILVISDDLDLPFLSYRLRLFGSGGGHNGLRNIEKCLNSNQFRRFRVGISKIKDVDTVSYVLGKFSSCDLEKIDKFLPKTFDILTDFCRMDFDKLMSKYNQR